MNKRVAKTPDPCLFETLISRNYPCTFVCTMQIDLSMALKFTMTYPIVDISFVMFCAVNFAVFRSFIRFTLTDFLKMVPSIPVHSYCYGVPIGDTNNWKRSVCVLFKRYQYTNYFDQEFRTYWIYSKYHYRSVEDVHSVRFFSIDCKNNKQQQQQ